MYSILITIAMLVGSMEHTSTIIIEDSFDAIEYNHFYNEKGKYLWTQILFLNWNEETQMLNVQAWIFNNEEEKNLENNWMSPKEIIITKTNKYCYKIIFNKDGVMRKIKSKMFWRTWTTYDREIEDKSYLPKESRLGLMSPFWFSPLPKNFIENEG